MIVKKMWCQKFLNLVPGPFLLELLGSNIVYGAA